MKLYKQYAVHNACYQNGKTIKPKGIMVHSTGANNSYLKRYVQPDDGRLGKNPYNNSFNMPLPGGRQVCVHAFIGRLADGSIATYQILPWNYRAWHAGGDANNTHIGFEICEDALNDKLYFDKVYKEAVELCVYLCKMFGLTEKDIICHSEGHRKGIASNHGDVMHWFPKFGKTMDTFRADVKNALGNATAKPVEAEKEESVKQTATTPYVVRITADELNVRNGASMAYKVNTVVKKGEAYTIVQELNGWGKLKSGAGWIKLSYTKKL